MDLCTMIVASTLLTVTVPEGEGRLATTADGARLLFHGAAGTVEVRASAPSSAIRSPRLVRTGAGATLFAEWREGDARWVAVSSDLGASWRGQRAMRDRIALRAGDVGRDIAPPTVPSFVAAAKGNVYLMQLATPSLEPLRARLTELGAEVLGYVPFDAHLVRMAEGVLMEVEKLPFVRWVGRYEPGFRATRGTLDELAATMGRGTSRRFVLQTFTPGPDEKARLAREIEVAGGRVERATPNGYWVEATLTAEEAVRMLASDHVQWLEPWSPFEEDMDIARDFSAANYVESVAGFNGTGVRGEVMDGGVQEDHQDFDGILIHGPAPGVDNHGTATYGIVFGNGTRDTPSDGDANATGHLPRAQGYFAGYPTLTDRYAHTAELVQAPIEAVFQSNSWGSSLTTAYNGISAEMDDIIWQNDIAIFQSQSNNGDRDSRPQAWAKNVFSIGGVRHYNTATAADDCWCGGASIGPGEDGRLKPDLAHFYDGVYCTDVEPGGYGAGPYTTGFGGTSAATPITAGIGGLFTEMWAANVFNTNPVGPTVFAKRPHAMTLKALMINTAEAYPFSGAGADLTRTHQGWGVANLRNAYDRAPLIKVIDETSVLRALERDAYLARVAAGQPELKITMAYMDRMGNPAATVARINDVTLHVVAPDGSEYWGNAGLDGGNWSTAGGVANTVDTVENVFIQNPLAGDWQVTILADEVNQDVHAETPEVDQDFALVVYGASSLTSCAGAVPPPTAVNASAAGDNQIRVTWTGTSPQYRVLRALGGCSGTFVPIATVSTATYLDTTVSGGVPYGYMVRALEACSSPDSVCVEATTTGPCFFDPVFAGLGQAAADGDGSCGVRLDWAGASGACGGPVVYNVYRSTDPAFTPAPANLLRACVAGSGLVDRGGLLPLQGYTYVVRAEDLAAAPNGGPCGGREEANLVRYTTTPLTLHATDFEGGASGWSNVSGSPAASTGDFVVGDPVGTNDGTNASQPEDDHGVAGVACFYTAENPSAAAGSADVDGGEVVALSPPFDMSRFASVSLSLWRWYHLRDLGADPGDYFAIDASNDDGANWVNVETLDQNQRANSWNQVAVNLEALLPLTASMRIRVRAADGTATGNIVEAAIDDVRIVSNGTCTTAVALPGVIAGGLGPLLATRVANQVHLQWSSDCAGATRYGVYRGDLALGLSSLAPIPGQCDVATRSVDLPLDASDDFYLIAPNDGSVEGSLGLLNLGVRRSQPAAFCYPRSVDSCAPGM